jgi:hypothetical protein
MPQEHLIKQAVARPLVVDTTSWSYICVVSTFGMREGMNWQDTPHIDWLQGWRCHSGCKDWDCEHGK